ncbi:hypothetical protein PR048_006491 [Dryococelus australis]|uniref:Uncharacterized protein n=1 Tax=Dryococelus australis TaxID=614101 RepID=A0ABQ9ICF7_9NEOP|nr:hypothetical protein PR048_006491 [Dryococelus australis]
MFQSLERLRYAVTKGVNYRNKEDHPDKIMLLKEDILNGPHHRNVKNLVPELEECGLFQNLKDASRLLEYVDSNYAENFNHAATSLQEGAMKQDAKVLLCNIIPAGMDQCKLHKTMFDTSPGMF